MIQHASKSQLDRMNLAQMRKHIEWLQSGQTQDAQSLQAQLSAAKAETEHFKTRLEQASKRLEKEGLAASRETSFYWRILMEIGRVLQVKDPDPVCGETVADGWRAYAEAVRKHVYEKFGSK